MQVEGRGNVVVPETFLELQRETALWLKRSRIDLTGHHPINVRASSFLRYCF